MRTVVVLMGSALIVAGCATTVAGNEAGGVIPGNGLVMATGKKFETAEAECAKYGKVARVKKVSAWDGTMTYECVVMEPNH